MKRILKPLAYAGLVLVSLIGGVTGQAIFPYYMDSIGVAHFTLTPVLGGCSGNPITCVANTGVPMATNASAIDMPQGRLTLTSGVPVPTASTAGATTIFYDSYAGNIVPVFNTVYDVPMVITANQISDALPNTGTGVVNTAGVFDEWAISVNGALTLCHATNGSGGGWASDTGGSNVARGTGYSQLNRTTRPYLTNQNAIPNCYNGSTQEGSIPANQATYLGTFATDGAGQTDAIFGGAASGGTAAFMGIWNYYQRVPYRAQITDSGASYSYSTATIREARGSTTNQASVVTGAAEDSTLANYAPVNQTSAVAGAALTYGVGVDSTTTFTGTAVKVIAAAAAGAAAEFPCPVVFSPAVGLHVISANEFGDGANNQVWDANSSSLLQVQGRW